MDYPEWVSSIMPIGNPAGGIKICMDFKDLNKEFPKDYFPLPKIDMIMDLIVGTKFSPSWKDFLSTTRSKSQKKVNTR